MWDNFGDLNVDEFESSWIQWNCVTQKSHLHQFDFLHQKNIKQLSPFNRHFTKQKISFSERERGGCGVYAACPAGTQCTAKG